MANPTFRENLGFCGTFSHISTILCRFIIVNNTMYMYNIITIENLRKLRKSDAVPCLGYRFR